MKYYLKASWQSEETEVSREEWIKAERSAGFYPKCASDHPKFMTELATSGFSGNGVSGRVEYDGNEE